VIQGDKDELVEIDSVRTWLASAPRAPAFVVVEGGEHFFHGKLAELRAAVLSNLGT
jgi:alpha/beta superfamily hydrolase